MINVDVLYKYINIFLSDFPQFHTFLGKLKPKLFSLCPKHPTPFQIKRVTPMFWSFTTLIEIKVMSKHEVITVTSRPKF